MSDLLSIHTIIHTSKKKEREKKKERTEFRSNIQCLCSFQNRGLPQSQSLDTIWPQIVDESKKTAETIIIDYKNDHSSTKIWKLAGCKEKNSGDEKACDCKDDS